MEHGKAIVGEGCIVVGGHLIDDVGREVIGLILETQLKLGPIGDGVSFFLDALGSLVCW